MIEKNDGGIFSKLTKNGIIFLAVEAAQDDCYCSSNLDFTPCSVMRLRDLADS